MNRRKHIKNLITILGTEATQHTLYLILSLPTEEDNVMLQDCALLWLVILSRTFTRASDFFFYLLRKPICSWYRQLQTSKGILITHSPWTQWVQVSWPTCLITELCPPTHIVPLFPHWVHYFSSQEMYVYFPNRL